MLAVLAIKSGLTHAGRPIKLSKEFVQLEDLYTWIWLQDLAEIYIQWL